MSSSRNTTRLKDFRTALIKLNESWEIAINNKIGNRKNIGKLKKKNRKGLPREIQARDSITPSQMFSHAHSLVFHFQTKVKLAIGSSFLTSLWIQPLLAMLLSVMKAFTLKDSQSGATDDQSRPVHLTHSKGTRKSVKSMCMSVV